MEIGDLQFGAQQALDPSRSEERAKDVLATMKRIAVVGASSNELRKSYRVVRFLADHGLQVVPLGEGPTIAGLPSAPELGSVAPAPDAVVVFCTPTEVGQTAVDLAGSDVGAVWFQEGLIDADAARLLEEAGKVVIMDRCVMRDYRRQVLGEEVESWFPV
ncbi:MAG: CoA-binding protein [Actinomycetota bacterium]